MMSFKFPLILFTFFFLFGTALASIQVYKFDDPVKEARFNTLAQELRCPKCQNNNLADSNSDLSVDLKTIIYEKINQGESDQQIIGYLKERYGDFIYYRPPVKPSTWLIWFGPFVFLALGGWFVYRFVAKKQDRSGGTDSALYQTNKALLSQWQNEVETESSFENESDGDHDNITQKDSKVGPK